MLQGSQGREARGMHMLGGMRKDILSWLQRNWVGDPRGPGWGVEECQRQRWVKPELKLRHSPLSVLPFRVNVSMMMRKKECQLGVQERRGEERRTWNPSGNLPGILQGWVQGDCVLGPGITAPGRGLGWGLCSAGLRTPGLQQETSPSCLDAGWWVGWRPRGTRNSCYDSQVFRPCVSTESRLFRLYVIKSPSTVSSLAVPLACWGWGWGGGVAFKAFPCPSCLIPG